MSPKCPQKSFFRTIMSPKCPQFDTPQTRINSLQDQDQKRGDKIKCPHFRKVAPVQQKTASRQRNRLNSFQSIFYSSQSIILFFYNVVIYLNNHFIGITQKLGNLFKRNSWHLVTKVCAIVMPEDMSR